MTTLREELTLFQESIGLSHNPDCAYMDVRRDLPCTCGLWENNQRVYAAHRRLDDALPLLLDVVDAARRASTGTHYEDELWSDLADLRDKVNAFDEATQ